MSIELRRNVTRTVRAGLRYGRRVPAAQRLWHAGVGRVQDSGLARELAARVFDLRLGFGGSVFLHAGKHLVGTRTENLPVVIVLICDATAEAVRTVTEEVAAEQVLSAGFRPVFVLDRPEMAAVRSHGYPVELLVPRDAWDEELFGPWERYLLNRLSTMRTDYSAAAVLPVRGAHLGQDELFVLRTLPA
ncbi:hypothetical protein PU560_03735 [Georgenia sp. 10Sc9-8]|uniref:Uncharacterized protein n=1 Tax=Georgenia halotolerans TaxID=3028317 RepID=A0ABT5TU38_9MICO|nr:hypothetical protein [Georgenia halotolerans]